MCVDPDRGLGTEIRQWVNPYPYFSLSPAEIREIREQKTLNSWTLVERQIIGENALKDLFSASDTDLNSSFQLGYLAMAEDLVNRLSCPPVDFVE